ncbi:UNVERIFIED_CONTAM: hypothetical protein FKN15_015991 [Acipenser sinensis]
MCTSFQKRFRAKRADRAEGRSTSSGSPWPLLTLLRRPSLEPSASCSARSVSRCLEHKTKEAKKHRNLPNADVPALRAQMMQLACTVANQQSLLERLLTVYQSQLLQDLSAQSSPHIINELRLVNDQLLQIARHSGQAIGRNLGALVVARCQFWLSQARVLDMDKVSLLKAPISPGYTFGPAVEEMLQQASRAKQAVPRNLPLAATGSARQRHQQRPQQRQRQPNSPAVAKLLDVTWEPLWLHDASFGSPRPGSWTWTKCPCSRRPSPQATPSGQPWKRCCSSFTVRGSCQSSSQLCFCDPHIPSTRGSSDGDPELLQHRPLAAPPGPSRQYPATYPWQQRAVPGRDPSSALNRGSASQTAQQTQQKQQQL